MMPSIPMILHIRHFLSGAGESGKESLIALACVWMLAACAPTQGWVPLDSPDSFHWQDDGSSLLLSRAIDGSIAYYRRLPAGQKFRFGALSYSPAEMIASLELFRNEFLAAPDGEDLARRLTERFHVFESVREGGRKNNRFTGYYEPELPASRRPRDNLDTPLYALPEDMVRVRLNRFGNHLPDLTLTGRIEAGELVPYFTRREIQENNLLMDKARPIAYLNEIDLFFLQIQGSGTLRFEDGEILKVGYAASNGHPYRSIGALMIRRKILEREEVSLQSIRSYLMANPEEVRRILYFNPSYVFFQVRKVGPLGNILVPLTPGRSLAVDDGIFPKGALVYVATRQPVPFEEKAEVEVNRFMLVQDTGGAIRGHGRGDLFWGRGKGAEWVAGHQNHGGRLFFLVAKKEYLALPEKRN